MNFPLTRLRRLRRTSAWRQLVSESQLSAQHWIYPVFVVSGKQRVEAVASLPGVARYSLDQLLPLAEKALALGLGGLALFPVIEAGKTADAAEALNPEGLLPQVVREIKQRFPELMLCTDIALDPYTSHGQDGLIDASGAVLNDPTVDVLVAQALVHAEAGADALCPSDMMDGRIGRIRQALEAQHHSHCVLVSYAAKYASSFYGPFRDAVGSAGLLGKADKKSYQMNPANSREAWREMALDIAEGADILMVKPGMPYLDILSQARQRFDVPLAVYQVSGEYAMLKAAALNGWLDHDQVMFESLLAFHRAGASMIWSYFALEAAEKLAA